MNPVIERARPDDEAEIVRLLHQHHLPVDGLHDHLSTTLVARVERGVAASAALEFYAEGALLRSVAVAPDWQGQGLGRQLTAAACRLARGRGVTALYLLTTTAEDYFRRIGFEAITREEVPASVKTSVEFTSACPTSALAMRLWFADAAVMFACVHNAGRSQMAAAFFNQLVAPSKAWAVSAGTQPANAVHTLVVEVMAEAGVDLSEAHPQRLTDEAAQRLQWLITMGCGEECPVVPGIRREDWPVPDPKDQPIESVRVIRDELRRRVRAFITREGWSPPEKYEGRSKKGEVGRQK